MLMEDERPSLDRLTRLGWGTMVVGIIAIIVWFVGVFTSNPQGASSTQVQPHGETQTQ